MIRRLILVLSVSICAQLGLPVMAPAAQGDKIAFTARTTAGKEVAVPAKDHPTVLLFGREGQPQSEQAIEQVRRLADPTRAGAVDVVVILSGNGNVASDKLHKEATAAGWPVVRDPDYQLSGKVGVHVWPTTVLFAPDGRERAHLAGLPPAFAADLEAHLDLALGKIDQAGLEQRLATRQTVSDNDQQRALRHIQIANQLMDRADLGGAQRAIDSAAKLHDDAAVQLARVRLLILSDKPADALAILDATPADGVPPWTLAILHGRAHVALKQWDQAKAALADALHLNPNPAEAHYLLGLVHQNKQDWQAAADAFRAAYEATLPRKSR
jgi:hypothetical protein